MTFTKITVAALTLTLITQISLAQVKKGTAPAKGKPAAAAQAAKPGLLPVDPNLTIGRLPNGFTYYIRKNAFPKNRAFLFLVTKAGSVLETDAQQGMAHFTERMAFNGTKDFTKADIEKFVKRPGTKFNPDGYATTTFDETIFQLVVPTDTAKVFEKGFNLLANFAGNVTFDPAEVDKEKAIVLADVQANGKTAQERIEQQTYPVILANSKYAQRLPAGKEDVIKTFTAAGLKSFYHDWYRPNLQAIIAVGDFDPKQVELLIKNNFSALKNPVPEKPRTTFSVPPAPGTIVKTITDKDVNYTAAQIIVKHPQIVVKTPAEFFDDMRINLFNQMLNARIAEVGIDRNCPFVAGQATYGGYAGRQDAFSMLVRAKPGQLEASVKAIIAETERAKKFGFTVTELERAKQNALQQISNVYANMERANSSSFLSSYVQSFINGSIVSGINYDYNFYIDKIGKVTVAEENALANKFITDQNRDVIIVAPEADKDKLPDDKTVLNWLTDAGKNLTPYNDDVNTEPIMATLPTPGKVVSRQDDSIINVTRLTLSNGVKVILKPTTYDSNGQVLINGYSFGGTSLAADKDFVAASLAGNVIAASGLANMDPTQLQIKLGGKQVNITPYISETVQGISGNSAPGDFETAMQLLYLYFTQPRKDTQSWQMAIDKAKAQIALRKVDPAGVFQDTVTALLNNYNRRSMPLTAEQLNNATLDQAYSFYKDRFADAANFTFTFVGNFTVEQIIPFLERYLASLPATNHNETYKNLGNHPVLGQVSKTISKGTGERATVQLIFSGTYDYNEDNNVQMDALEEVLNLRFATKLPEKEVGALSLSASINYVKIPEQRYKITISFACIPAGVDKIISVILNEINNLKQVGADQKEINTFAIEESKSIRSELKQNYFWAGYLASSAQYNEDPDRIIPHIQRLNQVTIESTKASANKYLNSANLIRLILLPEKK